MDISQAELDEKVCLHKLWLEDEPFGVRLVLPEIDLCGAELRYANLSHANLCKVNLSGSDLTNANLQGANLNSTMLDGATLSGTCLDPNNKPNGDVDGFEWVNDYVIGYRTKRSISVGCNVYEPGQRYKAPVFSTCPKTECHPGLYLCPTATTVRRQVGCRYLAVVKVRTAPEAVHRAGNKWRCKWFEVLEEV